MAYRVAVARCASCKHKWVELGGEREACIFPWCGSKKFEKPLFVGELRELYRKLSPTDKEYAVRRPLLEKLYLENSGLVLGRANESFEKASAFYGKGDFSDRVLNRLIFCFFAFEELGLHESAVSAGNLIALGYARRSDGVEVTKESDLVDLGRALQWFGLLGDGEWIATVNTRLGMLAAHAVAADSRQAHRLSQVAHKHLELALGHYKRQGKSDMPVPIERELSHVVPIQAGAVVGAGYVEGAEIQARATREAAQSEAKAIESAAEYIGLSLVRSAEMTSKAITEHGELVAQAIEEHGQAVQAGLVESGQRIGIGIDGLSESVRTGLGHVSGSLVKLGDRMQVGLQELGTEVRGGLTAAGEKIRKEMGSLGNKVALGVIGGGAIGGLLARDALLSLGSSISKSLDGATSTLADATRWAGKVQAGPQNILMLEGFDAARQALPSD